MSVRAAMRVADIIETFARERRALSLSELARLLDVPVSSCLSLVRTLVERGYLHDTGRRQGYYPTGRLLMMARQIAAHDPVIDRARPHMTALREQTGETIVFAKLTPELRVIYLEVLESAHPVRYTATPGDFREAHANSLGKALLWTLPPATREAWLAQASLTRFNERTLTEPGALERDLALSHERGWFRNLCESLPDVGAIAWPLKLSGQAYAMSVGAPAYRIEPCQARYAERLRAACAALEASG